MVRLIAHHDPEEGCVIKLPKGWTIWRDFEPHITALVLDTDDGVGVPIPISQLIDIRWVHRPIDLDGQTGIWLMAWVEFDALCEPMLLEAAVDPDVRKHFALALLEPVSDVVVDPSRYSELIRPEVAVMASTGF